MVIIGPLKVQANFRGHLRKSRYGTGRILMNAVCKRYAAGVMALAVVLVVGCNQSTTPAASEGTTAAAPAGPPALVTAKTAFNAMYTSAFKVGSGCCAA